MKLRIVLTLLTFGAILSGLLLPSNNTGPAITAVGDFAQGEENSISEFSGKRFAVKEGSIFHGLADEEFAASGVLLFDDYPSIYEAVLSGKVDAALRGYLSAEVSMFEPRFADLEIVRLTEEPWLLPLGAISMDQELIEAFDATIAELRASGVLDEMRERWFDNFDPLSPPNMPDIPSTGSNGEYVVAVSTDYIPFSFRGEGGSYLGFDIELANRFAASQGRTIRFQDTAFAAVLPSVISGRADFGISDIVITAERAEQVHFTDAYFVDDTALIHRVDAAAAAVASADTQDTESDGVGGWLRSGIQRNLVAEGRWRMIVSGLGVTLLISLAAQLLGTVFGAGLCFLLLRDNRFAKGLGKVFCTLVSGTPDLVLLMVIYYIAFGRSAVSNVVVAIIAFTILTAVIVAETMKSAIETVDRTEIEAAESLGFSPLRTFTTVTLPQAAHHALPGYLSDFVELVKGTAVVGFIAIMDLTRAGDVIRSNTYDAYFPILLVALIYILVTSLLVFVFKRLVKRINTGAFE